MRCPFCWGETKVMTTVVYEDGVKVSKGETGQRKLDAKTDMVLRVRKCKAPSCGRRFRTGELEIVNIPEEVPGLLALPVLRSESRRRPEPSRTSLDEGEG